MEYLKVGLLISEEGLRKWQVACLKEIREIEEIEIVAVVQQKTSPHASNSLGSKKLPFFKKVLRSIVMPSLMRPAQLPEWLFEIPFLGTRVKKQGFKEYFTEKDLKWIKAQKPDLLLRFGFGLISGKILNLAPHGVWSFHHGDLEEFRGRPPVFWELYHGKNRVGITLQRLEEKLDAGKVVARGFVPVNRGSFKKTLAKCYAQSPILLKKTIYFLVNEELELTKPKKLGSVYKNPGIARITLFYLILFKEYIHWFIEKAFFVYDWKVGMQQDIKLDPNTENVLNPSWLPRPESGFYADPAFSPVDSNIIFVEHWSPKSYKGSIKSLNLESGDPMSNILNKKHHLSFPKVYKHDSNYWLVPEMAGAGEQQAFLMDANCLKVSGESEIIEGRINGVDPVFLRYNNLWWIFISPKEENSCYHLNLYLSDSFFGPYHAHELNPIVIDPHGGRMAGPIIRNQNRMYRLGQVYNVRYGEGIHIFEIEKLNPGEYKENRVGSFRLSDSMQEIGIHSLEINGNNVLIDGYKLNWEWNAGINRIISKIKTAS